MTRKKKKKGQRQVPLLRHPLWSGLLDPSMEHDPGLPGRGITGRSLTNRPATEGNSDLSESPSTHFPQVITDEISQGTLSALALRSPLLWKRWQKAHKAELDAGETVSKRQPGHDLFKGQSLMKQSRLPHSLGYVWESCVSQLEPRRNSESPCVWGCSNEIKKTNTYEILGTQA